MTINLMSKDRVKIELGISSTDYDTSITAMIPVVSSHVRQILNNNYNKYVSASFDETSTDIDLLIGGIDSFLLGDGTVNFQGSTFPIGQVVTHPNLPVDTYITAYDPDTGLHTLSNTPDDAGEYVYPTITIGMWSPIAKMIWYRIQGLNITDYNNKDVSAETYGKISKTYAASEINKKWNYPQALLNDLGTPIAKVG